MTRHVIDEARLREDEVWVVCVCGERVAGDHAETVNEDFQAHRVAHGLKATRSMGDYKPQDAIRWRDTASAGTAAASRSKAEYYRANRERIVAQRREQRLRKKERAA